MKHFINLQEKWKASIFMLLCLSHATLGNRLKNKAYYLPERMLDLIRSYNERGASQVYDKSVVNIRAANEESRPFEMGYVMSEILERYRKMVGLAQRGRAFKIDTVFDMIKHLELIQKLFLEVFHLVNMLNEIGKKYGYMEHDPDKPEIHAASAIDADLMISKIQNIQKIRNMEKKKRMKKIKKERELYMKQGKVMDRKNRKPGNKWWPIDYGWEIDYQWF